MEYRGTEYSIVQGVQRCTWIWTVRLRDGTTKSGSAGSKGFAVDKAKRTINNALAPKGIHVGVVNGLGIFDISGKKLYDLKGANIYRLSGELVGHLNDATGSERRLDRVTDRLFPTSLT